MFESQQPSNNPLQQQRDKHGTSFETETDQSTPSQKVLEQFSTTVLDQVANRFVPVETHVARGHWKSIFTAMIVVFPLTTFAVMMWYQLYQACVAQSAFYLIGTKTAIGNFLGQSSIHYCGSVSADAAGNLFGCTLPSPNNNFNNAGQCAIFSDIFESQVMGGDCLDGEFELYYSQCTSIQTAIVNSVQYAIYAGIATVYIYVGLRVVKKRGFYGLFKWDNWLMVMNNKSLESPIENTSTSFDHRNSNNV